MSKEISFFKYLKARKFEIIFVFFVIIIFSALLFGNNIDTKIVIYGIILSSILFILLSLFGYYEYRKEYNSVLEFIQNDNLEFSGDVDNEIDRLLINELENIKRNKSIELSTDKDNLKKMNEFYTLWAHQIKTPIAAANLLIEDEVSLDDLQLEILRIEDYVNVLLAYFRHHSYSTDYVFEEVILDDVIKSVVRKYSALFIKKGIKLNYEPSNIKLITDGKWLGFILEQILSNSLKYTYEGEIQIKFLEDELIIRDTGIGIQESDLPRIFELGFTGFNGRIYSKSTGIGLNFVKSISESLNIEVTVISQLGEFTEVRLKFENISNLTKM